jgi:hypothetical protein
MITHYEKFRLLDKAGTRNLLVEVNWNPDDKDTNECKVLKLTYPDGTNAYVDKNYFNSLLFVIGNSEEQMKMIPQKLTTIRKYKTILGITAKEDIKKGQQINCAVEIDLPKVVDEIIGEYKGDRGEIKSKGGIILPASPKIWQK